MPDIKTNSVWIEEFKKLTGFDDIKNIGEMKSLIGFITNLLSAKDTEKEDALSEQRNKTMKKVMSFYGLTVADLPVFPPKDIDLLQIVMTIGNAKLLNEIK